MRPSKVRKLAQQYANNELSYEDYRVQRRRLIDLIVENNEPMRANTARHRLLGDWVKPVTRTQAVAVATGILALVVLAWSYWPTAPSSSTRAALAPSHRANTPGTRLLKAFLQQRHWQAKSLIDLQSQWRELSLTQRSAARHTVWYRRINAELRNRINQQRALAQLDTDSAARSRAARLSRLAHVLAR